ncbi:MAG: hypothetical protein LIP01_11755 [Tannerellaceae bacterium]|nr:hypothetical protein [Tannerellaceae bacterium]
MSYLGKLWYGIGIDNSELKSDAREATEVFSGISDTVEAEAARIDKAWSNVGKSIAGALTLASATKYVQQIYKVRSAFQDTESAMTVFLGSAEKASKFMNDLQDYAWYNMFEFSDLTEQSKKN